MCFSAGPTRGHMREPRRRAAGTLASRGPRVHQLEVCSDPASSKRTGTTFPTSSAHFTSLSHFTLLLSENIPRLQDIPPEHRIRSPLTCTQDALQDRSHVPVKSPHPRPLSVTLWPVAHQVLRPRDSPGKNTGVGCHALLQGSFPTRGQVCTGRQVLYH